MNHYETLGLEPDCSAEDIRAAYRLLAKTYHPDVSNVDASRIQAINDAYAVLKDPARRRAYDAQHVAKKDHLRRTEPPPIKETMLVSFAELLRGATLELHVKDPSHPAGMEMYPLIIQPETAPGARMIIKRSSPPGGTVHVRIKLRPDGRFKSRGSDLRCDLKIHARRAETGGIEMMRGPEGTMLSIKIPAHIERGGLIRIPGQGLPKPRGGRGDLVVRIMYRPEVRIKRGITEEYQAPRRRLIK